MSSGKKTLLVIATILVIGGGAISFGAFAAAGFNFENLSTESRNWTSSTKTFAPEAESPHTAIVLRDMGEDVRIERVPELTDVKTLCALLASCGCSVKKKATRWF